MIIQNKRINKELNLSKKDLNFKKKSLKMKFDLISKSFFVIMIGFFLTCLSISVPLAIVYESVSYSLWSFYNTLGIVLFGFSYIIYIVFSPKKGVDMLVLLNKRVDFLFFLIIGSIFSYFMLAWLLMILIGTFDGFGIKFNLSSGLALILSDAYLTLTQGLILFFVTLGIFIIIWIFNLVAQRFLKNIHLAFNLRRRFVEKVRMDAEK